MSTIPTLTDRLEAATQKAENGSAIMHAVANGDATTEVPTESGPVPSINKWFADLNNRTSGAVGQVQADLEEEVQAREQADQALEQALGQAIGVATQTNTHAAAAKDTPVNADEIPLVDSEDSNNLKKLTWAKLKAGIFSAWGALINGGTAKDAPADADAIAIMDSAASSATKKLLLSKLKAFVLTFTSANQASAATLNLTGQVGKAVHVTGTTTITAVTMVTGQSIDLIFDGVLTLTHHATNNNLPGAANITTAAGDRARYFYDGITVYCMQYQKANGTAVVAATGSVTGFTIIYPNGGSAASPANVSANATYITANPFPGRHVICEAQVFYSGVWSAAGWYTNNTGAIGVVARQKGNEIHTIVGLTGTLPRATIGGNTFGNSGADVLTPLPARVLCWEVEGAF